MYVRACWNKITQLVLIFLPCTNPLIYLNFNYSAIMGNLVYFRARLSGLLLISYLLTGRFS